MMETKSRRWVVSASCSLACAAAATVTGPMVDGHARSASLLAQEAGPTLASDRFGARLLSSIIAQGASDGNAVVSPVSAAFTLSLAALGARGATAEALAHVLGTPSRDRPTLVQLGEQTVMRLGHRTDVQLEIANAIWIDNAIRLSPSFAQSAARWEATASTVPLSSPEAVKRINQWADRSTHGRIKGLLDEPLPPSSRMLLANAVYFKGKWADAFEADATHPRDFALVSGRRIQVATMERTGQLAYGRGTGFQVLRLPYKGGRSAMYIILPDSAVGVRTLVQRFAAKGWPTQLGATAEQSIHLVLPKFHVEQSLSLRPAIEEMGGGVAFDCGRADFRDLGVAPWTGAPNPLCIDRAEQKVYIDVSEEGTEAAAVSGMDVVDTAAPPPPLQFIVDRPFLFVLRDEVSGSELFAGSIGRP